MANPLKMAEVHSIETHRKTGTSRREIARMLGLHRETVWKYVAATERRGEVAGQNRPNASTGLESAAGLSGVDGPQAILAVVPSRPQGDCAMLGDLR